MSKRERIISTRVFNKCELFPIELFITFPAIIDGLTLKNRQ